eukprot:gene1057-737_t
MKSVCDALGRRFWAGPADGFLLQRREHRAGFSENIVEKPTTLKIWDAGIGSGLSGMELRKAFEGKLKDLRLTGTDFSAELLEGTRKKSIYDDIEFCDLSKTFKYDDNSFDVMTLCGVMTYLDPSNMNIFQECCRFVKPGGYVILTHRSDQIGNWKVHSY